MGKEKTTAGNGVRRPETEVKETLSGGFKKIYALSLNNINKVIFRDSGIYYNHMDTFLYINFPCADSCP